MHEEFWHRIGEPLLVFRFSVLEKLMADMSTSLSVDITMCKMFVCLILPIPLGIIYNLLPNAISRNIYNFVLGIIMLQFAFGADFIHFIVSPIVSYVLMICTPRSHQHMVVLVWSVVYLTYCHVIQMYNNYLFLRIDFTGSLMVMIVRQSMTAINYHDSYSTDKDKESLKGRLKYQINAIPSISNYFGYIFNYSAVLAGPVFEYSVYRDGIKRGPNPSVAYMKENPKLSWDIRKKQLLTIFSKYLIFVICFGLHVIFKPSYNVSLMMAPDFKSRNYLYKLFFMYIVNFVNRLRYHAIFHSMESGTIICGFGYQQADDGKYLGWNGVQAIDSIGVETGTCIRDITRCWNMRIQHWLEQYVYLTMNKSLFITYLISSLWHGVYPGYFLFFLSIALLQQVERRVRRHFKSFFDQLSGASRTVSNFICCLVAVGFASYLDLPYLSADVRSARILWVEDFYCIPNIILGVLLIVFSLLSAKKEKKKL